MISLLCDVFDITEQEGWVLARLLIGSVKFSCSWACIQCVRQDSTSEFLYFEQERFGFFSYLCIFTKRRKRFAKVVGEDHVHNFNSH